MKYVVNTLRILTGLLFIFSGLIKANDPLGLSYKMQEFFSVLHLNLFSSAALTFSIIMIALETIAGVAVLVGYRMRFFASLILVLIIFFSFLTGYAFLSGKVKECGCFGDCIPLSAGASFAKDLVLMAMILVIFAFRKTTQPFFSRGFTGLAMAAGVLASLGLQWYALNHLPPVDCLPYAVGKNIAKEMLPPPGAVPDQYASVMTYEKNGQKKDFTQDNYPWKDTSWHFISRQDRLIKQGNSIPLIQDFDLSDFQGNDRTTAILGDPHLVFLLLVLDVDDAAKGWAAKMDSLQSDCLKYGIQVYGVTASSEQAVRVFSQANHLHFPFLQLDGTVIKTAGRSNPCLMLMAKGVVLGKWHYHDFPYHILSLNNQGIKLKH